ncbi:MAG: TIGR03013 family XrtA/PEP-CTERM system glycosyltransferase [Pseudomonadota bacterium]
MRIRLFGHYWHFGLMLLWASESIFIFASSWLAFELVVTRASSPLTPWVQSAVLGAFVLLSMISMGLLSRRLRDSMSGVALRIIMSVVAGSLLGTMVLGLTPEYRPQFAQVTLFGLICAVLLLMIRSIANRIIDDSIFKRSVLVYGAGNNAARIHQLRRRSDQRGFEVVGFMQSQIEDRVIPPDRIIAPDKPIIELCKSLQIDEIVVAMDDRRQQFPLKELLDCRLAGVEITELATFLERETGKVYLETLVPSWMIFSPGFRRDVIRRYSERAFDLLASLILLVIASPLMLLTILAIKLEDGLRAPLFYGQVRVGYANRNFRVLKFRSMRTDAEKDGAVWARANDDRVTRVGRFIRKTRIDELPQLLNVLSGQMSFVGPRPERPEFVQKLAESIPYYSERHAVKPGITGWAQLCYPYGASEKDAIEKLQYDLYYVKNHGLLFDILILMQTVEVILLGKGAR